VQFISQAFQKGSHVSHINIGWVQPLQLTTVIYRSINEKIIILEPQPLYTIPPRYGWI